MTIEKIPRGGSLNSKSVAIDLINFLNASPTAFHAVAEAKRRLTDAGFVQLSERDDWNLEVGKRYFFTRNHSALIAFAIGKRYVPGNGFCIVGAHTDSPCLKLKPVSKVSKGGFLEVGVQPYGSGMWHTWFDRDLTIAGRVITKKVKDGNMTYSHKLVRLHEPIMRIPTVAIHLDRTVNSDGFKPNSQTHVVPILATAVKTQLNRAHPMNGKTQSDNHHSILMELLASELGCNPSEICDFELQTCDTQPSVIGGAAKEFIFSGRLDNLCMSYCSLTALMDSTANESDLDEESSVRMVALFDNEEIGSRSAQGAASPIMHDVMTRITTGTNLGGESKHVIKAIQKSLLVSADMAHALHPNYTEKHEESHQPKVNGGFVIKFNANLRYATNAVSAFIFREIADKYHLPVQDFVVRNDAACGSTIGPHLSTGLGIRTVDVGAPQLSMHSIREMCGVDDVDYSYKHLKAFFQEFTRLESKIVVDK